MAFHCLMVLFQVCEDGLMLICTIVFPVVFQGLCPVDCVSVAFFLRCGR